jgi:hypothetical protein
VLALLQGEHPCDRRSLRETDHRNDQCRQRRSGHACICVTGRPRRTCPRRWRSFADPTRSRPDEPGRSGRARSASAPAVSTAVNATGRSADTAMKRERGGERR